MTAQYAMIEQRRRRYAEGDRVRVWLKVGERASVGTVTSAGNDVIKVRFDGEPGSRSANPLYTAPYVEHGKRLRTGVLLTAIPTLIVAVAVAASTGMLPLEPPWRIALFVLGAISLYFLVRGILVLRDSGDPLRPLPTYDPTKDYTTNNAG